MIMRCDRCANGERQSVFRSRLSEKGGYTAVVLGVPVEECPSCGQQWLTMAIAVRLDELCSQLLQSGAEVAYVRWAAA